MSSFSSRLSFQGQTIRDDEGRPLYVVNDARVDMERVGADGDLRATCRTWTVWPLDPTYLRITAARYARERQMGGES